MTNTEILQLIDKNDYKQAFGGYVNQCQHPSEGCHNAGKPYETHLISKSHEISFVRHINLSCHIVYKIYREHGTDNAVLCAKFEDMIWQIINKLLANEISRNLRWRWFWTDIRCCNRAPIITIYWTHGAVNKYSRWWQTAYHWHFIEMN